MRCTCFLDCSAKWVVGGMGLGGGGGGVSTHTYKKGSVLFCAKCVWANERKMGRSTRAAL